MKIQKLKTKNKGFTLSNAASRQFCQRQNYLTGFTLLEVIIAVLFVTIGMGGVFVVIQKSFSILSLSASRLVAANLAQEGLEVVRNIRDTNWLESEDWDYEIGGGIGETKYYEVHYDDNRADLLDPLVICDPCDNYDDMKFLHVDNNFYKYLVPAVPGKQTKFKRKITISDKTADSMKITAEVIWKERGGKEYNYIAHHLLYDWK